MTIFMQMTILALIVSNVLLCMVCKCLQIRLKRLEEKIVELGKCMMEGEE